MSDELPELTGDEALAAEHALGLLTGSERAAAEARMAADPAFTAEVEAWRERLAPMLDAVAPVAPPPALWASIERALPANDDLAGLRRSAAGWRRASFGAFGLLAASVAALVVLASRPPELIERPVAQASAPLLNANLATDQGQRLFIAAYDPARKALIVTSLAPAEAHPGKDHELWLIPADGKPRAVGLIPRGATLAIPVDALASLAAPGAKLAVSVEPPGGSTQDGPSGPVAAVGELAKI
ncbi:MAG: anti-sigma factor [Phenylobacterium sp.]